MEDKPDFHLLSVLIYEALLGRVFMSPVRISNFSTSQFRKVHMFLSEFCPAACRSWSFQLLHVAVSEPCGMSEFTLTGPHIF